MDPYESLERLKSRDGIFFTKEVVFSNTVRTMVNINDEVGDNEKSKKVRSGRKVELTHAIERLYNFTP
ncbi:unnamed protein product [Toxocara canis]|nr:unnamed protein product [Toxocara canis]